MFKKSILLICVLGIIVLAIYLIYVINYKTTNSIDQYVPHDYDVHQTQKLLRHVESIIIAENDFSGICITLDELRINHGEMVVDYAFCEYIVLEKFRNESLKFTGNPSTSEYHAIIEECYIVYLVEHDGDINTDTSQWAFNLDYLVSNYDVILETHKPNQLLKFYIDDYIEVYSHMLEEK